MNETRSTTTSHAHLAREHHDARERESSRQQAKDRLKQAGREAAAEGRRALEETRVHVNRFVRDAAQSGARCVEEGCRDACAALRDASKTLSDRKDTGAARYVESAAKGLDKTAEYLNRKDPGQIADDAGDIIRHHPAAVLGGLFVTGLLVGHFLRASSPQREYEDQTGDSFASGGQASPGFGTSGTQPQRPRQEWNAP